jgi:hypothetical protein
MNYLADQASRPANHLARVLLTLCAVATLLTASLLDARAAVNLLKFAAVWQNDGTILVAWETSSEMDAVAFFLYRSESKDGPWDDYIDFEPAAGNDFTGATYSFVDNEVTRGVTYWYRLEELAADDTSSFHGPITTGSGTSPATSTATATRSATTRPTATERPGQSSNPTATRQYTNTPAPSGASAGASSPAQTQSAAASARTVQTAPTRSSGLTVTTPTPVGGVPAPAAPASAPEVTATPEGGEPEPAAGPAAVETPILQLTPPAPTPSPTAQQVAAAPKETSQPLLDASATQSTSAPTAETPPNNGPDSRLALLLGIGALAAAAILGALALLIWRRRSR